jgi:hypothetical protein
MFYMFSTMLFEVRLLGAGGRLGALARRWSVGEAGAVCARQAQAEAGRGPRRWAVGLVPRTRLKATLRAKALA